MRSRHRTGPSFGGHAPPRADAQPVLLAAPLSRWPVKRRDQAESTFTVTVKSYQPSLFATTSKYAEALPPAATG